MFRARCVSAAVLVAMLGVSAAATSPAQACMAAVTMTTVDQAIAESKLSGSVGDEVRALRAKMAQALERHDVRAAGALEQQAMRLMGHEFVESGPPVRGGCNGAWVRATN